MASDMIWLVEEFRTAQNNTQAQISFFLPNNPGKPWLQAWYSSAVCVGGSRNHADGGECTISHLPRPVARHCQQLQDQTVDEEQEEESFNRVSRSHEELSRTLAVPIRGSFEVRSQPLERSGKQTKHRAAHDGSVWLWHSEHSWRNPVPLVLNEVREFFVPLLRIPP